MPSDAAGIFAGYDHVTGEITIEPVTTLITLQTDQGDTYGLAPARNGGYQVTFDSPASVYGFQIVVDGQPVAQDTISLDA